MKYLILFFSFFLLSEVTYSQLIFGQNKTKLQSPVDLNYSNPREYEIADIEIQGIEFLDNNALISLSGLKVGDKIKIPGDDISNAIKKLWKQGIIGNISIKASKIEGSQIWLVIEMTERPRLIKYEFDGVSKGHRTELEDDIELVKGKILTDVLIKNTEMSVKKFYESKGFLNAKVNILQRADTAVRNSATLVIKVNKGKKVKIQDVTFYGNENFSDAKLRSKFKKTGEKPKLTLPSKILVTSIKLINPLNTYHFLTNKDTATTQEFIDQLSQDAKMNVFKQFKLVASEYEDDKDLLIKFLNSKGYRDATITFDSTYLVDEKHLRIDVGISEGKKYYFRNIAFTGNFIYTDETLGKVLGVQKGDVYDLELIEKKLNYDPAGVDISSLYMDDGYLFFSINPIEVGIIEDSIDLEMRIYEGSQATINKVTISGNERTNDHVILRELRTIPGDKFSRALLIRTQRELSQLGYFNPEKVNPVPIPNPINETVDIDWQLEEQPSDQIELSGGWGGYYGFIGTLGVSFNNFSLKEALTFKSFPPMGDGQRLSIRAQANGKQYQSYTVSFTEPWLGGRKPNSFGVSYNYSTQNLLNFSNREIQGWLTVSGVTLSLGRRVTWPDDFFIISNAITFSQYGLHNYPYFTIGFNTGTANSLVFNTTIARRSSDNPMYPRRGSDISLSIAMTPPYSLWRNLDYRTADKIDVYKWVEYHKWNFDAWHYMELFEKLVMATRLHFGFIGSYTNEAGVGPFERFVLGGSGLTGQNFILGTDVIGLRGYPDPTNRSTQQTSLTPYDNEKQILGGTIFSKYNAELRYPVSLSPTATIYGLVFVEAGNNWNDFSKYNPYDLYRSAGVGVRIFMPAFGLLGLDWGYGFDTVPGQVGPAGSQFHFSLGQQLR